MTLAHCRCVRVLVCLLVVAPLWAQGGRWSVYTQENSGLPDNNVLSLLSTPEGRLWIGMRYGGLALLAGGMWSHFQLPAPPPGTAQPRFAAHGPQAQAIYDISLDSTGALWLGTKVHGLLRFADGSWTRYDTQNSDLPDNYTWDVVADEENRIWVGTRYGGVAVFDGGSWVTYNTATSPLPSNEVGCLALDGSGRMWIGTRQGLAVVEKQQWSVYTSANSGLPHDYIEAAAVDRGTGAIWLGTFGGGLARYDGQEWQVFTQHNSALPSDTIYSLSLSRDGTLLVGTFAAGLALFDGQSWQVFNASNSPVPHDLIYETTTDGEGATWIATTLGLACYRRSSSADVRIGPEAVPGNLELWPNTPNPFAQGTALRFRTPSASQVELGIFDLAGRRVRTLVQAWMGGGMHAVWWDGRDDLGRVLPSGVYLACVRAMGTNRTVRMLRLH